jgi:hypothetical protein
MQPGAVRQRLTIEEVEKKGLKFVDALMKQTTEFKMRELLAEYFLTMMLRDKAGQIMSRVFLIRAQLILLFALLKLLRIALKLL